MSSKPPQRLEPRNRDHFDWPKDPEDMSQWCLTCGSWEPDCVERGRCEVDPDLERSRRERWLKKQDDKAERRARTERVDAHWTGSERNELSVHGVIYRKKE